MQPRMGDGANETFEINLAGVGGERSAGAADEGSAVLRGAG